MVKRVRSHWRIRGRGSDACQPGPVLRHLDSQAVFISKFISHPKEEQRDANAGDEGALTDHPGRTTKLGAWGATMPASRLRQGNFALFLPFCLPPEKAIVRHAVQAGRRRWQTVFKKGQEEGFNSNIMQDRNFEAFASCSARKCSLSALGYWPCAKCAKLEAALYAE